MDDSTWPQRVAAVIAAELRRQRKLRGLTAQQLADRTAELGHPIARAVLSHIENGRRENVSIAELFVLGEALGLPPLWLLFPVGQVERVPVLPRLALEPLDGLDWAASYADVANPNHPVPDPWPGREHPAESATMRRHAWHRQAAIEWDAARRAAEAEDAPAEHHEDMRRAVAMITYIRDEMLKAGEVLPSLPPGMAEAVDAFTDKDTGRRVFRDAERWAAGEWMPDWATDANGGDQ